jgi:hypothetical protein
LQASEKSYEGAHPAQNTIVAVVLTIVAVVLTIHCTKANLLPAVQNVKYTYLSDFVLGQHAR